MTDPQRLWRIGVDAPDWEAHDLSGEGAATSGGRWNRVGTPMVYASASRSLACLETIVHLAAGTPLPLNRYLVAIIVPAATWDERAIFDPAGNIGWDAEPPGHVSLDWGTNWASGRTSVLAEVPSIIVPEESNYLINPRHPNATAVRASKVRKWTYDSRL